MKLEYILYFYRSLIIILFFVCDEKEDLKYYNIFILLGIYLEIII
jgi:hypothetical protein